MMTLKFLIILTQSGVRGTEHLLAGYAFEDSGERVPLEIPSSRVCP